MRPYRFWQNLYFHRVSAQEYFVDNVSTSPTAYAGIFIPGTGIPDPLLFNRYGVAKDTVFNLFIGPDHAGGGPNLSGVARGFGPDPAAPQANWVKVFNVYGNYRWRRENDGNPNIIPGYVIPDNSRITTANSFCHELGHMFNLKHPFDGSTGCTNLDTRFYRCTGGNLMSYCDATGNALSPCQLEQAHAAITNVSMLGAPDYRAYRNRTVIGCDAVPPRAFFTLASCANNPRTVYMDSRGTFNAQSAVINVYNSRKTLLATRSTTARPGSRWNIGQMLTISPTAAYWVELVAIGATGARHSSIQALQMSTLPDPCQATIPPTN